MKNLTNLKTWLVLVSAGTVLFVGIRQAKAADTVTVVAPNSLENNEGDTSSNPNFCLIPFRTQVILLASEFTSLPEDYWLTHFRLRPDGNLVTGPRSVTGDVQIRMSTTNASPPLSMTFADNIGSDETIVYNGPITLHTENVGPQGGPKDFDYIFDLQIPFFYIPNTGNILIEFLSSTGWSCLGPTADSHSLFAGGLVWADEDNALVADQLLDGGLVIEFTFAKPCEYDLVGDLNNDCRTDLLDVALLATNWLVDCDITPEDPACVPK